MSLEANMATSVFGGVGRPSDEESARRRREFLRLVFAEEVEGDEAARQARIKPERALAILTPILRSLAKAA